MVVKQWRISMKTEFLSGFKKLPPKDIAHIMEKVEMLGHDPTPDGKVKKHLVHCPGRPFRIRSGDYRIFYTYNENFISIYKIDRRDEATYRDCPEAEFGPDGADMPDNPDEAAPAELPPVDTTSILNTPTTQNRPLPEPITVELLNRLDVPAAYHTRLLRITDEDALLACPGVDEDTILGIEAYMFDLPLMQVMHQPSYWLNESDDLLRYKEGELLAFLLKLSPEQEKYAAWSLNTTGPTLVKGGPGTGKSTVALYRVRSLIEQLKARDASSEPRILFTTYTNALVEASRQLLAQLLGPDACYVQVSTTDKLVYEVLNEAHALSSDINKDSEQRQLLIQALGQAQFNGNRVQQYAQKMTIEHLGYDYLLQELNGVIVARQLTSLDEYLETPRAGRQVRLNATQRTAVWQVYEQWCELMRKSGKESWQQRRARAEQLVADSSYFQCFDAVVIDEAQDLDASALRLLINMCKASNRLFITADANQSIYGSGFNWSAVHRDLRFQGRTSVLRTNYRSTSEISEAAQSYLTSGALDTEAIERHYIHNGPIPDVRSISSYQHEIQLLATFFKQATRHLRQALSSCAILCPTNRIGQAIAEDLTRADIPATYMKGGELDLKRPGVKVITLSSAKGLEFPIVALAGFVTEHYPYIPAGTSDEGRDELLARERRVMFVGMTRAMRALLVIVPTQATTPLLQGFDPACWNCKNG
ncbi:MAG TPA: UvrD-helicase domain-containing protein [Ktedonobacteraceae bacterium]|jgi:superfamily I DNA/RNA helicase/mRNA-degrading endonuclease RelE of RelBE toxin-antitoxin system|nr:UvrD-helicase domain-containing protein [Ktedonobacteraceae bacterium]